MPNDSTSKDLACPEGLSLVMRKEGLTLVGDGVSLRGDLCHMLPRLRSDRLGKELLVRAARVRGIAKPVAVDATAGLGEDAILLAAAGFCVTLFERDAVIAALLRDSLRRARDEAALAHVVERMELVEGDAVVGLRDLAIPPDVVLLDPMFPARKKSAAVKKKLQLLQMLQKPADDEGALLQAAFDACPRKVVVKRPVKGPWLAGAKPSHSVTGKVVRYDVYTRQ